MLQFITNTSSNISVLDQIRAVLDGGCQWVQLRMKEVSEDEIKKTVENALPLCRQYEAFFVLNDNVALAKELEVDGVHIGKNDMSPAEARNILGGGPMIGVTANTFVDVMTVANLDIDYFGIGPYKYTTTKKNLASILGIAGYKNIVTEMVNHNIEIPFVAIGGITLDDIDILMEAGVNGIAVSGEIANSENIEKTTKEFINRLYKYRKDI